MFEDTNQTTEEITMPETLFGDGDTLTEGETPAPDVAEDADAVTRDDAPEGEKPEEDAEEKQTEEQTIRIKFNGEEQDIPISKAVTLAQKGMNYDHVVQKNDHLNAMIDRYAERAGMTREQYFEFLANADAEIERNAELEVLRARYPDADAALLNEIAEREIKIRGAENEKKRKEEKQQEEDARRVPWNIFFQKHPELRPEQLTQDFYDAVQAGGTPEEVYLSRRVAELEGKLATESKNRENASRAVGSARGDAGKPDTDAFLQGFLNAAY